MFRVLLPVAILFAAGCSSDQPLPMASTPEKARPALEGGLNAWKAGKTGDDLKAMSPSMILLDPDFTRGAKLLDYKIEGDGKPNGTGIRFAVTLNVERTGKGSSSRKVNFTIVTEPNTVISRDED